MDDAKKTVRTNRLSVSDFRSFFDAAASAELRKSMTEILPTLSVTLVHSVEMIYPVTKLFCCIQQPHRSLFHTKYSGKIIIINKDEWHYDGRPELRYEQLFPVHQVQLSIIFNDALLAIDNPHILVPMLYV